jgi:hypothetical protein
MRRHLLVGLACTSIILGLAACGEAGPTQNGTGNDARNSSQSRDFTAAADALAAKMGAPGAKAEMPPASDPAVQAFEAQAAKATTALGTDALPIEGFESYQALCAKTAGIVGAYAGAGTSGTAGAAQQQKMEANIEAYMDQMFTPLLFAARCNAAHMPFLDGEAKGASGEKATALGQVREGTFAQLMGLVQMASDRSFAADRRARIVQLLASEAANFALGLNAAQRGQVLQALQQLRATLPADLQAQADKARAGIEGARCGNICSAG